jgi:hypothetical protein
MFTFGKAKTATGEIKELRARVARNPCLTIYRMQIECVGMNFSRC